jgi:hypothetical protein
MLDYEFLVMQIFRDFGRMVFLVWLLTMDSHESLLWQQRSQSVKLITNFLLLTRSTKHEHSLPHLLMQCSISVANSPSSLNLTTGLIQQYFDDVGFCLNENAKEKDRYVISSCIILRFKMQ